jgi:hypothetical protein
VHIVLLRDQGFWQALFLNHPKAQKLTHPEDTLYVSLRWCCVCMIHASPECDHGSTTFNQQHHHVHPGAEATPGALQGWQPLHC